ncbi:MAG: hypothetical protein RR996_07425, partial [Alistipes sp.]
QETGTVCLQTREVARFRKNQSFLTVISALRSSLLLSRKKAKRKKDLAVRSPQTRRNKFFSTISALRSSLLLSRKKAKREKIFFLCTFGIITILRSRSPRFGATCLFYGLW